MILYPPFELNYPGLPVLNMGYHWIFTPPRIEIFNASVKISMLLMEWAGVLIVGGLAILLSRGRSAISESPILAGENSGAVAPVAGARSNVGRRARLFIPQLDQVPALLLVLVTGMGIIAYGNLYFFQRPVSELGYGLLALMFLSYLFKKGVIEYLCNAEPVEESPFSPETESILYSGLCPICHKSSITTDRLRVGYHNRTHSLDADAMSGLKIVTHSHELHYWIPICGRCKTRFLRACSSNWLPRALFMRDPSKKVLASRRGYIRGIREPYSTYNLRSERT
jgi:hypothetical protein